MEAILKLRSSPPPLFHLQEQTGLLYKLRPLSKPVFLIVPLKREILYKKKFFVSNRVSKVTKGKTENQLMAVETSVATDFVLNFIQLRVSLF